MFRNKINNFNIIPGGTEQERPELYSEIIHNKNFYCKNSQNKNLQGKETHSQTIYNYFVKFYTETYNKHINKINVRGETIFKALHHNNNVTNVKIINYKLIYYSLPLNKKFKNRYGKICYLCKKICNEDNSHLFIECEIAKKSHL